MYDIKTYKDLLNSEFLKRIKRNPQYSKRAFAKLLGVSAGALSEILSGKRKLTSKSAEKVAKALGYSNAEFERLKELVFQNNENIEIEPIESKKLESQNLDYSFVISNWYCFAILNLAKIKNFKWDISWIAKKLGVSEFEVNNAFEKLTSIGLLCPKGKKFEIKESLIETSTDVPSAAIKSYHKDILEKAIDAIELQKVEERDISGIGFSIDKKDLKNIKKEISDFQEYIAKKYNKDKKADEVYQLQMAFFKLTKE